METFDFARLRRFPDVEADTLFAVDAADRLILDEAAAVLAEAAPGSVAVVGDNYGALALGAAALHGATRVRVHQDTLTGERAILENARRTGLEDRVELRHLGAELLSGARVVLMRLPRGLDALDEISQHIARWADPEVIVIAGGMQKHMTVTMNAVAGRHFDQVSASLGRQKARVLRFAEPRVSEGTWPRREWLPELKLWVSAHGAAFAGTKLDHGTRFLLQNLDDAAPGARTAIDLGCGTGILAAALAQRRPGLRVIATDRSEAATASATATMVANDLADRVTVVRDIGLESQPEASADLIVLNPPFHLEAAVHTGAALALFEQAARVLRPGGELRCVFNSHLAYAPLLQRIVGPTKQIARNSKFTVTSSLR
jgi:16S rRNA (guanine1207-N2)-methyltransferase